MAYLERSLLDKNLAELIGEAPSPKRGYGVLTYYYSSDPKKVLLTEPQEGRTIIYMLSFLTTKQPGRNFKV